MSPPAQNPVEGGNDIQGPEVPLVRSRESTPSDEAIILAPELASIRAPYQGEDSRVTLLRTFDDKLQEWAAPLLAGKVVEQEGQSDSPVTISIETARIYQLITRGSIQVIEKLQSENGQLEGDSWILQSENRQLQQDNWRLQSELHEMKARACFLESEYNELKVRHSALELKELEWGHTVTLDAMEYGGMAQVTLDMCAARKSETREEEEEGQGRKRRREE